jgi:hypothetical protein
LAQLNTKEVFLMNSKIKISLKAFFLACFAVSLIIFGLLRLRLLHEYPLSSSVAAVNTIADESYNNPEYRINEAEILRTMSLLKEEFKTLNVTRFTDRILRTRSSHMDLTSLSTRMVLYQ